MAQKKTNPPFPIPHPLTILMVGDVMTGRGIDQVLPHPADPRIHESYMQSAAGYVDLAERTYGHIPKPAGAAYIWGDALPEMRRSAPDVRLINLETSITTSDDYWQRKGINYRMNPENIAAITAAEIDICALANNHVLDWGYAGLDETLQTLQRANIRFAGAGRDINQAAAPAVMEAGDKGRVVVFSYGLESSGIPPNWRAAQGKAGVNLLDNLSEAAVGRIQDDVSAVRQTGDIVVASIHWCGNWGYEVPRSQKVFARRLIDRAGIDIIHGHSSHHFKGIEVYHGRLIAYGCGDLINDYEGIGGYEAFRADLALMYVVRVNPETGDLLQLKIAPLQIRNFRLNRASRDDAAWVGDVLNREGHKFGTRVWMNADNSLSLHWTG